LFLFFADQLTEFYSAFNALTYITTRGILSALTALVVSFIIGPKLIQKLSLNDIGESIRKDGPETHSVKQGTPTMGGLLSSSQLRSAHSFGGILRAGTLSMFCS